MSEGWVPSGAQKRLVACVRDLSGPDRVGGWGGARWAFILTFSWCILLSFKL